MPRQPDFLAKVLLCTKLLHNIASQSALTDDRFIASDVVHDNNGSEHVRFDRTYRGMRVIGGDIIVHARKENRLDATLYAIKINMLKNIDKSN